MPAARKGICAFLLVALLSIGALSGCSSAEPTTASALAHTGILGGVVDELKREDDKAEIREMRENGPQSPQERQEARDQAEQATMEAYGPTEGEGSS